MTLCEKVTFSFIDDYMSAAIYYMYLYSIINDYPVIG